LRYLEYYEFSLVRKALQEREVLLKSAPHIMWPLRFVMPHDPSMRPAWMVRAGLLLYDHLAQPTVLPGSTSLRLRDHELGRCLKPHLDRAFVYSDGWVDDADWWCSTPSMPGNGARASSPARAAASPSAAPTPGQPRCSRRPGRRASCGPGRWSMQPVPGPSPSCTARRSRRARGRWPAAACD